MDKPDELLTSAQAAEILEVSDVRVRQFCLEGRLVARHIGPMWVIRRADVVAFSKIPRPVGRPPVAGDDQTEA